MGFFKLGSMTLKSLFKKAPTRRYPYETREPYERTRGHVVMEDFEGCVMCTICQKKCPANAITIDKEEGTWTYHPYKCVVCDACVTACPKKVLKLDNHYTPITTELWDDVHKKPPLTPEQIAEKKRLKAERQAKIEAALAAKKAKEEAAAAAGEDDTSGE